jgi:OTU domain-containing protein 6
MLAKTQARKAAALEQSYVPGDPAVEAQLEREAQEEQASIDRVCSELGLQIHEES